MPANCSNDDECNNDTTNLNISCISGGLDKVHELIGIKIMFGLLYCCVFLLAVVGNSLVIYIVISNRSMQTVTNLFITNLAVSDVIVNCTSLWLTPLYTYLGKWVWGVVLCYGLPLFQGASIFISSYTLTAIAVDRYIIILYPFAKRMSSQMCLAIVGLVWCIGLVFVAPYAVHMSLDPTPCDVQICHERWTNTRIRVVYGIVVMSLQFGAPFLIIVFCYTRIWFHLKYRASTLGQRSDAEISRKRRMLKMLISMVIIYALCWIPPNVTNILLDSYGTELTENAYFVFIFILAHLISMTATMWNPFLYAFMNDNFKREFRAIFRGRCRRIGNNDGGDDTKSTAETALLATAESHRRTAAGGGGGGGGCRYSTVEDAENSKLNIKRPLLTTSLNSTPR